MNLFLSELKTILTDEQVITDKARKLPYIFSQRNFFEHNVSAVLLPNSTQQISQIMKLCFKHKQPIIAQGGNTGLVGGQQGVLGANNIILSLKKLNKVININKYDFVVTSESGVILSDLHKEVENEGLIFPLQLASQASCQIGGNIASNAGGLAVLSYGSMRDLCLGLEVVLSDGTILNDMRTVKKDNMGYDVKNLFIGSEGTLGIITKAVLKLYPKPVNKQLCYISFNSIDDVIEFYTIAKQKFAMQLTSYELISEFAMQLSLDYIKKYRSALRNLKQKKSLWYILLEVSSFDADDNIVGRLEKLLEYGLEKQIIIDATMAQSIKDTEYFWCIRESLSAAQKATNVSIKNDISIPLLNMHKFIVEAHKTIYKITPNASIVCFGHIGDGNLHYNILAPQNIGKEFLKNWGSVTNAINELVMKYGGSVAAEHGIGQLKRQELATFKDPVAYKLMQNIKKQLDPYNILNPEKIIY